MTDRNQGPYLDALWTVLSRSGWRAVMAAAICRARMCLPATCGTWRCARLCTPSMQAIEVALRNTLFGAAEAAYPFSGSPGHDQIACWLDVPGILMGDETKRVAAVSRVCGTSTYLSTRAEWSRSLGFWTALFDVRYENTRILWPRLFGQKIFAHAPRSKRSRKALSPLFNRMRLLRNRAFHHEPIWHWKDLQDQHALALDLIGWMSPALREWRCSSASTPCIRTGWSRSGRS